MRPESFAPPSLQEVTGYAKENGLSEKINVLKFYEYYSKTDFLFRGLPMDWKSKMKEWAEREKKPKSQIVSAAEYSASKSAIFKSRKDFEDYWAKVFKITEGWGK